MAAAISAQPPLPHIRSNEIGLSGRHILFVDVGNKQAIAEARALFAHTAADCVELSLEEHDEVMAWVLGLSHLVNIAFAGALAQSGEKVPIVGCKSFLIQRLGGTNSIGGKVIG